MFRDWLANNKVENFDFSAPLFEKAGSEVYKNFKYAHKYIAEGEKYLDYNWPVIKATDYIAFKTEGSRLKHEDIHFARRTALIALTLAEIMEDKGRFLPQIVNGIFAVCEETYWGLSAHFPPSNYRHNIPEPDDGYIDLFASETAACLSLIYYILYERIYDYCPEILTRIEYEMNRRIVKSYLTHRDWFWQGYNVPINNWNPWIISNVLTVFLIVEKSKSVRDEGIRKMLFEIDNIYQSYPEDGGCDEGASYWGVSGGAVCEFCEQIYTSTRGKINFFDDEKLRQVAKYPYRVYIGNGYVTNFADGSSRMTGAGKQVIDSYIYGKRMEDNSLCAFAGELIREAVKDDSFFANRDYMRSVIYRITDFDKIVAFEETEREKDIVLPNLENSFVRRGNWFYASKGGNNAERHNHNDVGSFIVYYENSPVLVDPSCGVYTAQTFHGDRYGIWTMQSGWHNTPVINGVMQKNGADFKSNGFEFSEGKTSISFASAYPKEAEVLKVERIVDLTENGIVLCDNFEFSKNSNTICEHFVTPFDVEITSDGAVIGGTFLIKTETDGEISADSVDFNGDRRLTDYWNTDRMNRIIITSKHDKTGKVEIKLVKI